MVDTGCEMVVMGRGAARQAGIKPSMMQKGAVALRCADERVTAPFDRSLERIPVVLNPGTPGETTVGAYVVVTPGDNDVVLLGMSVIGKVGLTANAYKGKMKYYKDWKTRGTTSVRIPAVFEVLDTVAHPCRPRSQRKPLWWMRAWQALCHRWPLQCQSLTCSMQTFQYYTYRERLLEELDLSFDESVMPLRQKEAPPPPITLAGYANLRPLEPRHRGRLY